jgi:hypothetical protein
MRERQLTLRALPVLLATLATSGCADPSEDDTNGQTTLDAGTLDGGQDASAPPLDGNLPRDATSDTGSQDALLATRFSFFVTSLRAMQRLSGSPDGFGGDLRFGEQGEGAGLRGADKICATIAEQSLPGAGTKGWHAFLSASSGGAGGGPLHAIDRIGNGPWYDRQGRLLAESRADLLHERPQGAHPSILNDLPNEDGIPNHNPDGSGELDNHNTLTGSNEQGQLYAPSAGSTCNDWTSAAGATGTPRVGHSWIRNVLGTGESLLSSRNWMSALNEAGCAPGATQSELGMLNPAADSVGGSSGYGGIYCFASEP